MARWPLVLLVGCSFEHGTAVIDAAPDAKSSAMPDAPNPVPDASMPMPDALAVTGSITISVATLGTANLDLTGEGTTDWAHWGIGSGSGFTHKVGGTSISNLTATPALNFSGSPFTASWSNGTPQATVAMSSSGVGVHDGSYLQFTVSAGTTPQTLRLYVGAQLAAGQLDVTLSDGSATIGPKTQASSNGTTNYRYTIVYNAATSGQQLTVRWTDTMDYGNSSQSFAALLEATLQ